MILPTFPLLFSYLFQTFYLDQAPFERKQKKFRAKSPNLFPRRFFEKMFSLEGTVLFFEVRFEIRKKQLAVRFHDHAFVFSARSRSEIHEIIPALEAVDIHARTVRALVVRPLVSVSVFRQKRKRFLYVLFFRVRHFLAKFSVFRRSQIKVSLLSFRFFHPSTVIHTAILKIVDNFYHFSAKLSTKRECLFVFSVFCRFLWITPSCFSTQKSDFKKKSGG